MSWRSTYNQLFRGFHISKMFRYLYLIKTTNLSLVPLLATPPWLAGNWHGGITLVQLRTYHIMENWSWYFAMCVQQLMRCYNLPIGKDANWSINTSLKCFLKVLGLTSMLMPVLRMFAFEWQLNSGLGKRSHIYWHFAGFT